MIRKFYTASQKIRSANVLMRYYSPLASKPKESMNYEKANKNLDKFPRREERHRLCVCEREVLVHKHENGGEMDRKLEYFNV